MAEPLRSKDDRYGGVEVDVTEAAGAMAPAEFDLVLREACAEWAAQGKKGVWLKVPLASGSAVGAAAANGFIFHHAQPAYAMMTRWLPPVPSTLPNYSFTQIGVGGVVRGERKDWAWTGSPHLSISSPAHFTHPDPPPPTRRSHTHTHEHTSITATDVPRTTKPTQSACRRGDARRATDILLLSAPVLSRYWCWCWVWLVAGPVILVVDAGDPRSGLRSPAVARRHG